MIRVLIKASSPVVKAGLESLVRATTGMDVISDPFDDPGAGSAAITDLQAADVVLAELENRDDALAQEAFDEAMDGVPVILLVHGSIAEWSDALRQGVKAVLPSSVTGSQVAAAIEAAAAGLAVFHPDEIESLFQSRRMSEPSEIIAEALTPREIEVLRLLAEGLGNKEIASRLGISEHTAKFHVASIMGKLGAASRTEAVTLGIRQGIVLI
jgi:two-component system, NarL family, response regulator YdfI